MSISFGCSSTRYADHRLHPAFHLSAHTGMRRGEVLGLRWCDLDLDADRLVGSPGPRVDRVRGPAVGREDRAQGGGRSTWTRARVDVLRRWRIERAEEKGGVEPQGDELVFTKPDGSWIHPQSFSQVLDRKVAKLDVPTISLHDLRHTHADAAAQGRRAGEGRERAARSRQRRLHDERLPARPPWHAGRGGCHLLASHPQAAIECRCREASRLAGGPADSLPIGSPTSPVPSPDRGPSPW